MWTREQAAMFFRDVIKTEPDFSRLSQSVLQGYTCAVANEMEPERVQELAKVMKRKNVKLGADQLSCLVKMVMLRGIPKDLDSYPNDLLLFLRPSDYAATGSCKQYFANVGKASLDLLQRESSERRQLLLEALACLVCVQGHKAGGCQQSEGAKMLLYSGIQFYLISLCLVLLQKIPGTQVNKENAKILGHLVCDLGGEYIRSSAGALLKELSQCESFLPDQEEAIRSVISSGNTTFGPPQAWSASTLNELTGLIPVLDHSIWQKVPKNVLTFWLKNFARDSRLSRAQLATIVEELLPSRQKRDVGCPGELRITETVLNNDLMPIYYTPEELRACLKNVSVTNDFLQILDYPFSNEQLAVLKEKLDETYPDGYPDSLLPKLGRLTSLITTKDISKWKITSADMLAALLELDLQNEQVGIWVCFPAQICFLVWELLV
uniref:Mesothelin n=1 Tax=Phasianus colchicus TaxID=9054 RepID=A0A669QU03_PHACC